MMIPCLLLLGILFIGGDKLSSSGYLWPILVGLFIIGHIWMMFSGHGERERRKNDDTENKTDDTLVKPETKDEDSKHKHGNCCH